MSTSPTDSVYSPMLDAEGKPVELSEYLKRITAAIGLLAEVQGHDVFQAVVQIMNDPKR